MEKKEVKKWQDEEALRRYQMIAPLLEPEMDEGKRQQLREEAAEKNGIPWSIMNPRGHPSRPAGSRRNRNG